MKVEPHSFSNVFRTRIFKIVFQSYVYVGGLPCSNTTGGVASKRHVCQHQHNLSVLECYCVMKIKDNFNRNYLYLALFFPAVYPFLQIMSVCLLSWCMSVPHYFRQQFKDNLLTNWQLVDNVHTRRINLPCMTGAGTASMRCRMIYNDTFWSSL